MIRDPGHPAVDSLTKIDENSFISNLNMRHTLMPCKMEHLGILLHPLF